MYFCSICIIYILLICYSVSARPNVDIYKYICMSCKNIMLLVASTSTPKLMTCVIQRWPNLALLHPPEVIEYMPHLSFEADAVIHVCHDAEVTPEERFGRPLEVKGSNVFFCPFNLGTKKQGPFTWGLLGNILDSKNSCLEVIEVSIGEPGS